VLGHIQRGGRPTAFDRSLAVTLGRHAVELISEGVSNQVVGFKNSSVINIPMSEVDTTPKRDRQYDIDTFEMTK